MKTIRMLFVSLSILTAVALAGFQAQAEDRPPPGHPGPPAAAIEACQGKNEGDACTVQLPDRSLSGVCRTDDDKLVCWPDRPPPRPRSDQAVP
jgi:hypothetical protein